MSRTIYHEHDKIFVLFSSRYFYSLTQGNYIKLIMPKNFISKLCFLIIVYCLPSVCISREKIEDQLQKSLQCRVYDSKNYRFIKLDKEQNNLFKENICSRHKKRIIADILGWVPDFNPNNICHGFYYQDFIGPNVSKETVIQLQKANYSLGREVSAEGMVELIQGNQYLSADKISIKNHRSSGIFNKIYLSGNVNMRRPGQLVVSNSGRVNIYNGTTIFNNAYYLIQIQNESDKFPSSIGKLKSCTGFGHGYAGKIVQHSKTSYTLKNATYTTAGPYNDWVLKISKLELDHVSGLGKGYNNALYIKKVPILYFPYLKFPIDNRQHSGFSYPVFGFNKKTGYYLFIPFYCNLAPQYDLILVPKIYNDRGVLIDGNFRYFSQNQRGEVNAKYMPYDHKAVNHRRAFSIVNHRNYRILLVQ